MSRHALCVGINSYPDPRNRLEGCVNDAKCWKRYLAGQGFHVTLLTDKRATFDNMMGGNNRIQRRRGEQEVTRRQP